MMEIKEGNLQEIKKRVLNVTKRGGKRRLTKITSTLLEEERKK